MAEVRLDCGHPAVVTHERGDRLVQCAVPKCSGANVVTAYAQVNVVYEIHPAPGQLVLPAESEALNG